MGKTINQAFDNLTEESNANAQKLIDFLDAKALINWKELSRQLSGSDNSIRRNKHPKKYESKINDLISLITKWSQDESITCMSCECQIKKDAALVFCGDCGT